MKATTEVGRQVAGLVIVSTWVVSLAACATADPWNESAKVASEPDEPYRNGADEAVRPPEASEPETRGPKTVPSEGATLDLPECVDIALANHPELRAVWLEARKAAARAGERRGAYLPDLDLRAGASRGVSTVSTRRVDPEASNRWSASLELSYLSILAGCHPTRM